MSQYPAGIIEPFLVKYVFQVVFCSILNEII